MCSYKDKSRIEYFVAGIESDRHRVTIIIINVTIIRVTIIIILKRFPQLTNVELINYDNLRNIKLVEV